MPDDPKAWRPSGGASDDQPGLLARFRARSARRGEEAELRDFYREHSGELFGLAYRALGDRGLAEEVVQETFVRAWRSRERFDSRRGSVRTWLFAIARNLVIDAARSRGVRPSLASPGAQESGEQPHNREDLTDHALRAMLVREAVERLSEDHRRVLTEVHYRDRPYAEVAREIGVPVGTLRSRSYYALRSLRLILEEMEFSDGEQ